MASVHPDFSVIEAIPRTQSLLAMLPRLDRSGMRSLNLVLPADIAFRLKQEVLGSSTQAVAIVVRWVLSDLESRGASLVWTENCEPPYQLVRGIRHPLIDASGRKAGNDSKTGYRSMLASLPPLTHQALRTSGKGSLRAIVMTALEYGIQELDRRELTLTLAQENTVAAVKGKVVVALTKADEEIKNQQLVAGICYTLSWLGYDAIPFDSEVTYSANDILLDLAGIHSNEVSSFPGSIVEAPSIWSVSGDPACWSIGIIKNDTEDLRWCLNDKGLDVKEALSGYRSTYCQNCGSGAKGTNFTQVFVPSLNSAINLCGHCAGMHKV